jgi:transposase IS200-family protein
MDLDKNRHSVYRLQFHLVVVTKYKQPIINKDINERLKQIAISIFEKAWNVKIIQIETECDHIHILFESSPQVQLSKLVNNFKTVSARLIRKEFKDQVDKYYYKPLFWSNSYCIISSGGAPIETIKKYIEGQNKLTI